MAAMAIKATTRRIPGRRRPYPALMQTPDVHTIEDLKTWAAAGRAAIDPKPILAVIGKPVAHSLSPQLHQAALDQFGIEGQYIRIEIEPGAVRQAFDLMAGLGFTGCNVTVPHKVEALQAVDEADTLAQRIGAVNTVLFQDDLKLGFNSDGPGLVRAIREEFSVDLKDLRVMVLGAGGGAGRAAAVQCALENCERVVLVNRTTDKATDLAAELRTMLHGTPVLGPRSRIQALPLDPRKIEAQLDALDLVINATSVGLKPTDPPLLPAAILQPHLLVYDLIYKPARTRLLRDAAAAGCRGANGLSMLLHQGVVSFGHWFGDEPDPNPMRQALMDA